MDKYSIVFKDDRPKYVQVAESIQNMIISGNMEEKEKLPSIRNMSKYLGINKDTVIRAYDRLCEYGYCYQKPGSGTYVKRGDTGNSFRKTYSAALKNLNNQHRDYIDFVGDNIREEFFPIENLKKCLNFVMDRDGAEAFLHRDANGYEGLRKTISEELWHKKYAPGEFLIISGAQQGIDLISRTILNARDNVVVESPTYNGALNVFNWRKANIIDIPLEEDGVDVEKFEKILMKHDIKCFYTMGSLQNPTGITYSNEKKKRILELAQIYDFYILEDDYMSELTYDENHSTVSFKSLDKYNKVIYVKSFSKIFLPGIRLGYIILPKELTESVLNYKMNTDISTSSIMQRALEVYIKHGYWKIHIEKLKNEYEKRYIFLTANINESLRENLQYIDCKGGLSIYFTIKNSMNSIELFQKCLKEGVVITPGVFFYKDFTDGYNHFKIGFARATEKDILNGLSIINKILHEQRGKAFE